MSRYFRMIERLLLGIAGLICSHGVHASPAGTYTLNDASFTSGTVAFFDRFSYVPGPDQFVFSSAGFTDAFNTYALPFLQLTQTSPSNFTVDFDLAGTAAARFYLSTSLSNAIYIDQVFVVDYTPNAHGQPLFNDVSDYKTAIEPSPLVSPIPEPGTLVLLTTGLLALKLSSKLPKHLARGKKWPTADLGSRRVLSS